MSESQVLMAGVLKETSFVDQCCLINVRYDESRFEATVPALSLRCSCMRSQVAKRFCCDTVGVQDAPDPETLDS
jgi:hypothetical protein